MHPSPVVATLALPLVLVYGAAACAIEGPEGRFAPAERAAAPPEEGFRSARAESAATPGKANDLDRFTQAPQKSTRHTVAHILESTDRIGVFLGLPDGWVNDDPSYVLFFPRGRDPKPPARAVAMTMPEPGVTAGNKEHLLARGAEPTGLVDAQWESWRDGQVSINRFTAAVASGRGRSVLAKEGDRVAIAAIVAVDGAPALGFVGSWAASEPHHEAAMFDMLRNIERCQVEVGRGCVGDSEHTGSM